MSGYSELKQNQSSVQDVDLSTGTQKPKERKKQEKKLRSDLTQERVRELFNYDPVLGSLTRRIDRGGGRGDCRAGTNVGTPTKNGYLITTVDQVPILVHRLIWLYMEGYIPEYVVDHINRDKKDHRWCNLREESAACNQRNSKTPKNNKTGIRGISFSKKDRVWLASLTAGESKKIVGRSKDFTEAVAIRLCAEQYSDWPDHDTISPAFLYMQAYLKGEDMLVYLQKIKSENEVKTCNPT